MVRNLSMESMYIMDRRITMDQESTVTGSTKLLVGWNKLDTILCRTYIVQLATNLVQL